MTTYCILWRTITRMCRQSPGDGLKVARWPIRTNGVPEVNGSVPIFWIGVLFFPPHSCHQLTIGTDTDPFNRLAAMVIEDALPRSSEADNIYIMQLKLLICIKMYTRHSRSEHVKKHEKTWKSLFYFSQQ